MRKTQFVNGEFYHIFNRGIEKRNIFSDFEDFSRFFQSIDQFNTIEPIGSIYENLFSKDLLKKQKKLVDFICYCVNPNHYHFVLKQLLEKGIEKFMHRVGTGYTKYFNNKYKRSGSLFQGTFKSVHIDSNEYLLHISAYVNLNAKVHQLGSLASKFGKSSWDEYVNNKNGFCDKDIILGQFKSPAEYKNFTESSLMDIRERKEMEKFLLE
ncbi:MAG: transposase [Candidatus Parcubacteria bacterium]|nr:transposase [Candidatus Parcubacteria bacterium]